MRVFLSHSTKDSGLSEKLYQDLRERALSVWIDRIEMRAGDVLLDKIKDGIANSDVLLVLVTKNSVKSSWVRKEIKIAYELGLNGNGPRVVPLVLQPCSIPTSLKGKLHIKIGRNNLKISEIIKSIYPESFIVKLSLSRDFELDGAGLFKSLRDYFTGDFKKIHIFIENGNFNEQVKSVLKNTMEHRQFFVDGADRLSRINESLPVVLPVFWSSLAAVAEQLIADLYNKAGKHLGTLREITNSLIAIFEYSLHSMAFYLSDAILADEAASLGHDGLARFMMRNDCTDRRELICKRQGLKLHDLHAVDLVAKEGFMHTRVWAQLSWNDTMDLQPGVKVEASVAGIHWYDEHLPQVIGREILTTCLHGGLPLQKGERIIGLHMENYVKAGLG